jgi:hypothetical protein
VKPDDEELEALVKKQQFQCHNAEIHSTGSVHISHAFTTSYVYVIYCNITVLLLGTEMCISLFCFLPFHLLLCRSVVHEIGSL